MKDKVFRNVYKQTEDTLKINHNVGQRMQMQEKYSNYKTSMTIKKNRKDRLLINIPLNLNDRITQLDLSHNQISNIDGIQNYTQLQSIILADNLIQHMEQIEKLKFLPNLKTLHLEGNIIAKKINYRYLVALQIPSLDSIDELDLTVCTRQKLKTWQHQIGVMLITFQYQKCCILNSSDFTEEISEELKYIKKSISSIQNKNQQDTMSNYILLSNKLLSDLLPLQNLSNKSMNRQNFKEIQQYLMELMIKTGAKEEPELIDYLLSQIQTSHPDQGKKLGADPLACMLILSRQLLTEYNKGCQLQKQSKFNQGQNDDNIKHLLSAETALDSNEERITSESKTLFHFAADPKYLNILTKILIFQIEGILKFFSDKKQSNISKEEYGSEGHNHSLEHKNKLKIITKAQKVNQYQNYSINQQEQDNYSLTENSFHPYENQYILQNILDSMQKSLVSVYFRRLKIFCHYYQYQSTLEILKRLDYVSSLQCYEEAFRRFKKQKIRNQMIYQQLRKAKISRIFKVWRNIKKRRQKLLKKIVKNKIKDDKFLQAITLEKWKINSAVQRMRKMASEVLLKTGPRPIIPQSKIGINQMYKRVIAKYKLK